MHYCAVWGGVKGINYSLLTKFYISLKLIIPLVLKDCGSKKGETCVKWRGRCNARAVMTSTAHNNIAGALIMSHPYLVIHFRNCRVVLLSKLLSIITPHQYITITVTTTLMIVKSNNPSPILTSCIYHTYC